MLRGKMTVGIIGEELVVRVIDQKMAGVLRSKAVRPMDFNRKPMKEFVFVSQGAFENDADLIKWISLGIEHARHKLNI